MRRKKLFNVILKFDFRMDLGSNSGAALNDAKEQQADNSKSPLHLTVVLVHRGKPEAWRAPARRHGPASGKDGPLLACESARGHFQTKRRGTSRGKEKGATLGRVRHGNGR